MIAANLTADVSMLAAVLSACGAKPGGRVLDVGCGDASLVTALGEAGFDAEGLGEEAEPGERLHRGGMANSVPFAAGEADVAIVRDLGAYDGDLDGLEALISTANLLSCLRPLGRAVFVREDAAAAVGAKPTPRQAELIAHLGRFPCRAETLSRGEGLGRFFSPAFLLGRRPRRGASLVVAQVPKQPVSRLQWHGYAREAAMGEMQRAA